MLTRTKNDYETVQGVLEAGLRYLQPANEPVAHTTSRTDSGVHAFDNCLHVDLLPRHGRSPYAPSYITHNLNNFLSMAGVNIKVKSTQAVSPVFNARHCVSMRHYLYRIAVPKEPCSSSYKNNDRRHYHQYDWPLPELDRAFLLRKTMDITKLRDGCTLLQRNADFASFMAAPSKSTTPPKSTVKNLEVSLSPGQPLMDASVDPVYSKLDFYNITFSSHSFLHNQIRRCVAVLVALAQDVITTEQVEHMFQDPRPANAPKGVGLAPACGLYLLKVDYPDHVLLPDYCREEGVSDSIMRFVDIKTRVKTMVALGQSNFQKENRVIDKLYVKFRRLEELRDSILKEAACQRIEKEEPASSVSINYQNEENNSAVNEIKSDSGAQKQIQSLFEINNSAVEKNGTKESPSTNDDSKTGTKTSVGSDIMRGYNKRKILDKLYTLLMTRDEIDGEISVLMESLIKANTMNKNCYDEEAMEKTALEIIESRRIDREVKIRMAQMSKLYDPRITGERTTDNVLSSEKDEALVSVQSGEK